MRLSSALGLYTCGYGVISCISHFAIFNSPMEYQPAESPVLLQVTTEALRPPVRKPLSEVQMPLKGSHRSKTNILGEYWVHRC